MSDKLSFRDERACLNIAKGMNQTDAMTEAGFDSKWIATHTSRWLKRANVAQYIAVLREKTTTSGILDITQRKEKLSQIASSGIKGEVSARDVISAISEHNRMDGVTDKPGNQDNRAIYFIVSKEADLSLIKGIGERLQLPQEVEEDN